MSSGTPLATRRAVMAAGLPPLVLGGCVEEPAPKPPELSWFSSTEERARARLWAQVNLDTAFATSVIPSVPAAAEGATPTGWTGQIGWSGGGGMTAYPLTAITPGLVDCALELWRVTRSGSAQRELPAARAELERIYSNPGWQCFLVTVRPEMRRTNDNRFFAIEIDPAHRNTRVRDIHRQARLLRREAFGLEPIPFRVTSDQALLFFPRMPANPEEARYWVEIEEIFYSALRWDGARVRNRDPQTIRFRFERTNVRVLSMVERGLSWASITEDYLQPQASINEALLGRFAGIMVDMVFRSVVRTLLRA